jgi:hypothetical protein
VTYFKRTFAALALVVAISFVFVSGARADRALATHRDAVVFAPVVDASVHTVTLGTVTSGIPVLATTTSGVPAVTAPTDLNGVVELFKPIADSFHDGHYEIGVGLLLLVLIFACRNYLMQGAFAKLHPNWIPWITLAASCLGSTSAGLLAKQPWLPSLLYGLGPAAIAVLTWELAGKHTLGAVAKPDPDGT